MCFNYRDSSPSACESPQSVGYYRNTEIIVKMPPRVNEPAIEAAFDEKRAGGINDNDGLHGRGLYHYGKWWEKVEVDIIVNGQMITGIPIFTDRNTLRVVNDTYSYFIPLEKVDYIRTHDGLA